MLESLGQAGREWEETIKTHNKTKTKGHEQGGLQDWAHRGKVQYGDGKLYKQGVGERGRVGCGGVGRPQETK